jgi:hypothetical protein
LAPAPCLLQSAGEFREYYLPLSNEEIEKDLHHLSALLQQMGAGKRTRRSAAVHMQAAAGEASSDEYSPSSQQGEDENESGNPSDQQQWAGHEHMAQHAGIGGAPQGALAPAAPQQQQVAMA